MIRRTIAAAGMPALALILATASASAQPAERPARFSMAPADGGGFVRLDTDTGAMAICQRAGNEWACRDMQDNGRQVLQERDRLMAENKQLKSEIKRLEDLVVANTNRGPDSKNDRHAERFNLPSEEEVDKALSYVERMFKKFRDKMKELEGNRGATPL